MFPGSLSKEFALLAAASRMTLNGIREPLPSTTDLDWNFIVTAAENHGVVVLLARALSKLEDVPKAAAGRLQTLAREQTERTLVITRQLRQVLDALSHHGVTALPLKGPVLAATLYGDVALRGMSCDLDLFVQPGEFGKALDVIRSLGYDRVEVNLDQQDQRIWESVAHLHPRGVGVVVDLQMELMGDACTGPFDFFADTLVRPLFGTDVRLLSHADLLVYLSMHAARHFWRRLLWVCDVAALINSSPALDWTHVATRSALFGAQQDLAVTLSLASSLFGVDIPGGLRGDLCGRPRVPLLTRLALNRMQPAAEGKEPILPVRVLEGLVLRETVTQRLRYLFGRLKPNATHRAALPVPLPRYLSWLPWLIRVLRLVTGTRGQVVRRE